MGFEIRSISECPMDMIVHMLTTRKLYKHSCPGPNPDHRKVTILCVNSVAMKLLEKLNAKAQSAFLKLPEKFYLFN